MISAALMLFANTLLFSLRLDRSGSFPRPLKAEEEREYLTRMAQGDMEARNKLIEHNLRLVAHIAKKYVHSGVEQDDLVSIGSIGLMKAVQTFRPEAGRLTAYASRCIENEILMTLRANRKNRAVVLMGEAAGVDKEGRELPLADLLGTDPNLVADEVETRLEEKKLIEKISKLSKRERKVIELRFGIGTDHRLTQREISQVLGISRSYVSRIEKRALTKLYKDMSNEGYQ